ncbi:olfactory receptor 5I1-like [Ambystoma mexicanum]|uniref:olfactory receptor 5I1-like n=1 Tax=Ambystoma mexicanum TaxID=8296 RepID=UPI0037E9AFB9
METRNASLSLEFILLGLTTESKLDVVLFLVFGALYLLALIGNFAIILTIYFQPQLHNPMYFFLSNLSFLDICCSTTTIPKMLINLMSEAKTISLSGCIVQLFVFTWVVITELLLLTSMAFDRYVAICQPLRYMIIINWNVCWRLAGTVWILGAMSSTAHTSVTFQLSFCASHKINHFFCEAQPLLKLSCTDTTVNEVMIITTDVIVGIICFIFILTSYCFILVSILKIHSTEGKKKAFSTCAAHITIVVMYYGTLFFAYLQPKSSVFPNMGKSLAVLYTALIPLLNPLLYSLRNKDVKNGLKKLCWESLFKHYVLF